MGFRGEVMGWCLGVREVGLEGRDPSLAVLPPLGKARHGRSTLPECGISLHEHFPHLPGELRVQERARRFRRKRPTPCYY